MDDKNIHSDQFLKDLASPKNPFKTPENYFDNLSDRICMQKSESQLPETTGFSTPENYFDTLGSKINLQQPDKVTGFKTPTDYIKNFEVKKPQTKIVSFLPYISVAAAILISFFVFNNNNSIEENNLNTTEIVNYLALESSINLDEIINSLEDNNDLFSEATFEDIDITTDQLSLELNEFDIIDF